MDCRMILTIALAMVLVGIIEEGLCGAVTKRFKRPVRQRNRGKHHMSINVVPIKTRDWKIKLRPVVQKAEEHGKSLIFFGNDDKRNPPAFDYPRTKRTAKDHRTFARPNVYVLIGILGLLIAVVISSCYMGFVFVRWYWQEHGRHGHAATVTAQFT